MKIAIVHYHLQPGGVTRVIENTLQAWEENGTEIEAVALSGRAYPGDRLPDTRVVQGLDYTSPGDAVDPEFLLKDSGHQLKMLWDKLPISGISIIIHWGKTLR